MSESKSQASQKAIEQSLQDKEFALKVQETLNQLKIDRRNLWLSSPLLIAIATSIGGLAGATFTGIIEAFSNAQLERQKFEFSIIEKELTRIYPEEEDTEVLNEEDTEVLNEEDTEVLNEEDTEVLNEEDTEVLNEEDTEVIEKEKAEALAEAQREAAKSLKFLVDIGIIKSLNKEAIKELAKDPSNLPSLQTEVSSLTVRTIQAPAPANAANLRAGGGTQYSVVGTFRNGTTVILLGEFGRGWYRVQIGDLIGWMEGKALGL
ncbi:SH3 domain-containing protein [Leptolyngbya cf. ectocarpi LEGE 11479]|uniref:SH3 domain-containing protein n=1 Tax=Leptolyngbya cf. ectocarpi LEGE 11479 TaxID=1828722 RepID=A0A929F6W8_LEPEC|nr:SH3 domain-containing protein [Leptolyngbya ectocarpi]MBE9067896.1 SH3 domain-containing protein [Leptolyngbya cf. ectocarpi LEGE 11479]